MPEENEESDQPPLELTVEPAERAGVWANWAHVCHTEHEFTIDFVRLDPLVANTGIVVARVSVSPLLITQLIETLQADWDRFVPKTMPQEVRGSEDETEPEQEQDNDEPEDKADCQEP